MATWGVKLYQDDVAVYIREKIKDLLHREKTTEEILDQLLKEHSYEIFDSDDGPVFWFSLADTLWNYGRLLPEIKEQAVSLLEKGGDIARWEITEPKKASNRKKILDELWKKIESPQPPEKKISQYRLYKCEWQIGDVYAYQFNSEYSIEKKIFQKYIYFVKVQEKIWHPGHVIPVVYFYKKIDNVLSGIDSLNSIDYIPQFFKPVAYENDPNRKKLYLLALINTSSRIIPKNLLSYIGRINNVKCINNEDINPYSIGWKSFETYMIDNFETWSS